MLSVPGSKFKEAEAPTVVIVNLSLPFTPTRKGFNVEPLAVSRLNKYPVPVLEDVSVKLNRLEDPVALPYVNVVV